MNKKDIIKKSNYLIETPCKLSIIEQKIVYELLKEIKKGNKSSYEFLVHTMAENIGLDPKSSYKQIKIATRSLRNRMMSISYDAEYISKFLEETKKRNDFDEKEIKLIEKYATKTEIQTGWISDAVYEDGSGKVSLFISTLVKPFLWYLSERYTELDYNHLVQMKSSYSIKIYELLKQYQNINGKGASQWERTFPLEELKKVLGADNKSYSIYGNFKRKALITSHEEINSLSNMDITFDFKEIKENKKVVGIKFIVQTKQSKDSTSSAVQNAEQPLSLLDSEIQKIISLFKIKYAGKLEEKFVRNMIDAKGSEYIFERMRDFFTFLKTYKNKITNKGGLFYRFVMEEITVQDPFSDKEFDAYSDEIETIPKAIRISEELGFTDDD